MFEPLLICTLCVKLQGSFSVLVCITCIILCLFCALNRGVGAFQFPSLLLLLIISNKKRVPYVCCGLFAGCERVSAQAVGVAGGCIHLWSVSPSPILNPYSWVSVYKNIDMYSAGAVCGGHTEKGAVSVHVLVYVWLWQGDIWHTHILYIHTQTHMYIHTHIHTKPTRQQQKHSPKQQQITTTKWQLKQQQKKEGLFLHIGVACSVWTDTSLSK